MVKNWLVVCLMLVCSSVYPQNFHIGIFGGASAYQGDLTEGILPKKTTNGVIGLTVNYELMDNLVLRGGINYTILSGADRYSNNDSLRARNLSFETKLVEGNVLAEFYLMNLNYQKFSPYLFAGLAVFHFNPYAYSASGQQVYLKPLSTEGQGLSQYPDRKPYKLTQLAIPFGGGVKYAFSEKWRLGLEFGLRKLFTDYLDDVSTSYADANDLLAAKGQLAVDMAYRGDELPNGNPAYPAKAAQRGGANFKDWYYFLGLHLTYRLGSGGLNFMKGEKGYGCPSVPL